MNNRSKLLILYHSGAGSTKTIAEIYYKKLNSYFVDIKSISLEYDYKKLEGYDFLIFAFPTYHCSPSTFMTEFVRNMPILSEVKKAFAFTTCGTYSGNALREFIKECSLKNININEYSVYRSPATDAVLLFPSIIHKHFTKYEKNITHKIEEDIKRIKVIIENDESKVRYPPFKLYEVLNYPNKVLGKLYKHKLKILKHKCINCNKCINNCVLKCWNKFREYPQYEVLKCEFCFKCVHHCPSGAIVLSERTKTKIKLNEEFYNNLKEEILNAML